MLLHGQPSQRDQGADAPKAGDIAQQANQESRREPANAGNGLQALPEGRQLLTGAQLRFELPLDSQQALVQLHTMRFDLGAAPVGESTGFQPIAFLAQHLQHIRAMLQQVPQADDLVR